MLVVAVSKFPFSSVARVLTVIVRVFPNKSSKLASVGVAKLLKV